MKSKISIAILGSRGIPNNYGGFEAFAEEIAQRLVQGGYKVAVYTSNDHPIKTEYWKGVQRILINNPEDKYGSFGQFIYDYNCNKHSCSQNFDIILHLGYTSDSIFYPFWDKKALHITNMDGLEWKRSKYSSSVKLFLRLAERLACRKSIYLVADSLAIQKYLKSKYTVPVAYISYGAVIPDSVNVKVLEKYLLKPFQYNLIIARMEPENNIEMAIKAHIESPVTYPLIIIGNNNYYKQHLVNKYVDDKQIVFLDAIYDKLIIDSFRSYCYMYIHGHSVGGTNPSLLEAMACKSYIVAHDNPFNRAVLNANALYYTSSTDLAKILSQNIENERNNFVNENLNKIKTLYNWELVTKQYESLFAKILS